MAKKKVVRRVKVGQYRASIVIIVPVWLLGSYGVDIPVKRGESILVVRRVKVSLNSSVRTVGI